MVVIRLARGGSKNRPAYKIVVADSRSPRDGRFIERLGFYHPMQRGTSEFLRIATERLDYWVDQGAQPSATVKRLLKTLPKVAVTAGTTSASDAPA